MGVLTPKPLETAYAGTRFRSRLEARWAVFFDYLSIEWQYEPNGYVVGPRDDRQPYLPDFFLPNVVRGGTWAEVKGALTVADQRKLLYAAHPVYGLPATKQRFRLLLLGDVPRVDPGWMCWQHIIGWELDLEYEIDGLTTSCAIFKGNGKLEHTEMPGVSIDMMKPEANNPSAWNFGAYVDAEPCLRGWGASERVSRAYTAARSARFGT